MIDTSLDLLRSSLAIFGNVRKMSGNVRLAFGTILKNLRESSESDRKSSENPQNWHVDIIKSTLRMLEDINFMSSWQELYLTRSVRSLVRYSSCHSNIKFIYYLNTIVLSGFLILRKSIYFRM